MRGFSTPTLLLAAALVGRAIASDDSASSPSNIGLGDGGQAAPVDMVITEEPDRVTINTPPGDEILEDGVSVEWDNDWLPQSTDDDVEYLQAVVERLQREIDARRSQFHEPDEAPESSSGSVFHKIVRFLTSFGGTEEIDSGKGGWHWPKFPFPPHHGHGRGNHTHGNHTFPPPHHGHGNHTWPPHHGKGNHTWPPHHGHGNHTHHGHGNHTHGNYTHPPHHGPPFRLPPHFCRPPHHGPPPPRHGPPPPPPHGPPPPHHGPPPPPHGPPPPPPHGPPPPPPHHGPPPHHKPHPPKKPDDDSPPPTGDLEPPCQSHGQEPIFIQGQGPNSVVSSLSTFLHRPLFQITITPGNLILTLALCVMFIRLFHRIRAVASRRRYSRYQRRPRFLQARGRVRNFVTRLFSQPAQRNEWAAGDEKLPMPVSVPESRTPPPGYYDLDDELEVCTFAVEDTGRCVKSANWVSQEQQFYGGEKYDEKVALAKMEVTSEKDEGGEEDLMSMSEEIASFRSVADLVSDMVAAEEGRAVGEKK